MKSLIALTNSTAAGASQGLLMTPSENVEFSWRKLSNSGKKIPSLRCNMAGGVYDNHLWLLMGTGAGNGRSSEVWKYSIKDEKWSPVLCMGEIPSARDGHSASYVGNGKFLIFGGQGEPIANNKADRTGDSASKTKTLLAREVFNDVYEFDCEERMWTVRHPSGGTPPTSRRLHSANYISGNDNHGLGSTSGDRNMSLASQSASNRRDLALPGTEHLKKLDTLTKVPNNSLLIYGGCGIEPTKKSEQVYNDLWCYIIDTGSWASLQTRGAVPRPQSGHKSELIGDTLVIIGGIPATSFTLSKSDQVLAASLSSMTDSVMTLNIQTLTWTYLDTRDALGRTIKLNLYGHSVCTDMGTGNDKDGEKQRNTILIFGGKNSSEYKDTEKEKEKEREEKSKASHCNKHFMRLNVVSGLVVPVSSRDEAPDNRYGHIAVSLEVGTSGPESSGPGSRRNSAFPSRADPIMLLFGGSGLDSGGFCDPEVFSFVRTARTEVTDDVQAYRSQKSSARGKRVESKSGTVRPSNAFDVDRGQSRERSREGSRSESRTSLSGLRNQRERSRTDKTSNFTQNENENEKSIWQRLQDKNYLNGGTVVEPGETWKDLKLLLSYPTTIRDGTVHTPEPIIYPPHGIEKKLATDLTPDSYRIARDLEKEIKKMEIIESKNKNKKCTLSSRMFIKENEHNLENSISYKNTHNSNYKNVPIMTHLEIGKGAKSMLLLLHNDNEMNKIMTNKKYKMRLPDDSKLESLQNLKNQETENRESKNNTLPLLKGSDKALTTESNGEKYPTRNKIDHYRSEVSLYQDFQFSKNRKK